MNTWVFQGNPKRFNIEQYIDENEYIWWSIRQISIIKDIDIGDEVYLWKADDLEKKSGGIVAKAVIISEPVERIDETAQKYWLTDDWMKSGIGVKLQVIEKRLGNKKLFRTEIVKHHELTELRIIKFSNNTNYIVNLEMARILKTYWDKDKTNWQIIKEVSERYVKKNGEPFRLGDFIKDLLYEYPTREENSLRPVIQGATVNGKGETPSGLGKELFYRMSKGKYVLYKNRFPIKYYSWSVYSDNIATKKMDKSTFLYKGTALPKEMRSYFGVDNLKAGKKKLLSIQYIDKEYKFYIERGSDNLERTRMFWKSDFDKVIRDRYRRLYYQFKNDKEVKETPVLRFIRLASIQYEVQFIDDVEEAILGDKDTEMTTNKEGKSKRVYSTVYERDRKNRKKAIEIHGIKCVVCGFDFEKVYGIRGQGFIEIHHRVPLSEKQTEVFINPLEDLVPVCPNCHRMIHRKKYDVLTIEELKRLIYKCNV